MSHGDQAGLLIPDSVCSDYPTTTTRDTIEDPQWLTGKQAICRQSGARVPVLLSSIRREYTTFVDVRRLLLCVCHLFDGRFGGVNYK